MIESAEQFIELRLSTDQADYHRAAHDEAPFAVWHRVIEVYPSFRFWVAQNKTVPVEILEVLSEDPDPDVRGMVARKRKLPEHLQLKLAADHDVTVRSGIAWNAKATKAVLEYLAHDVEPAIRKKVRERLHHKLS
ncbi:MAG TPA: HEAT repeat domain-containing protein [Herpetosiphonaceae bacterium]